MACSTRLSPLVVASALLHAIPVVLLARPARSHSDAPPPPPEPAVDAELDESEPSTTATPASRGGAVGPGHAAGHPGRRAAASPTPPRRAASLGLLARDLAQAGPALVSDATTAWDVPVDTRARHVGGTTQRGGRSATAVTDPNARLGGAPDGDEDGDGEGGGGGGGRRGLRRPASLGGDKH